MPERCQNAQCAPKQEVGIAMPEADLDGESLSEGPTAGTARERPVNLIEE
jgi:hypothetical protein